MTAIQTSHSFHSYVLLVSASELQVASQVVLRTPGMAQEGPCGGAHIRDIILQKSESPGEDSDVALGTWANATVGHRAEPFVVMGAGDDTGISLHGIAQ